MYISIRLNAHGVSNMFAVIGYLISQAEYVDLIRGVCVGGIDK